MGYLQRLLHPEERSNGADHHSRHIDDQLEPAELQDVVVNGPAVPDGILDGPEIVVQNHDLSRFLGRLRTAAHGKAHICSLQSRRIVDAVSGHTYYQIHLLTESYHSGLVRGKRPGDHTDLSNDLLHLVVGHLIELRGSKRPVGLFLQKPRILCDGNRRLQTVSGDHDHLDPRISHLFDGVSRLRPHIVPDRHKTDDHQILMDRIFHQFFF